MCEFFVAPVKLLSQLLLQVSREKIFERFDVLRVVVVVIGYYPD